MKTGMEAVSIKTEQRATRREQGRYYTPPSIVQYMLERSLLPMLGERTTADAVPLRILDLSCGDGAFLLQAYRLLNEWYSDSLTDVQPVSAESPTDSALLATDRLNIIGRHLFGVDIDLAAVDALRAELAERIGKGGMPAEIAKNDAVIRQSIQHGDALTGRDFHTDPPRSRSLLSDDGNDIALPLNWRTTFPQVAAIGGFDLIIGNPPYRRELNAKTTFDRIANTTLGRRWRQPRMDLWYYFLHRGLDLLRPGGTLSFIVNSYWTGSAGARKLIERLDAESTLVEIVLLGKAPLFPDVSGQHLIFRLRKERRFASCLVVDLSRAHKSLPGILHSLVSPDETRLMTRNRFKTVESIGVAGVERGEPPVSHRLGVPSGQPQPPRIALETASTENISTFSIAEAEIYSLDRQDLFQHGRLSLRRPDPLLDQLKGCPPLSEFYEVRQGIAENPPVITSRHCREFGQRFRRGEGVFVVTADEIETFGLSDDERSFLRPYYEASAVDRYHVPDKPDRFVLYLTRGNAPDINAIPQIGRHLQRFRPILDRRRETRQGKLCWWQLHWPREERLFQHPRILSVQMSRVPQFAFAEAPTYVGFSVNLILRRPETRFALTTLTAILNSSLACRWFEHHAKRRGIHLEISGGTLRQFPLPQSNAVIEQELDRIVRDRQAIERPDGESHNLSQATGLEQRIDALVCRLYGMTPESILSEPT